MTFYHHHHHGGRVKGMIMRRWAQILSYLFVIEHEDCNEKRLPAYHTRRHCPALCTLPNNITANQFRTITGIITFPCLLFFFFDIFFSMERDFIAGETGLLLLSPTKHAPHGLTHSGQASPPGPLLLHCSNGASFLQKNSLSNSHYNACTVAWSCLNFRS